MKYGTQMRLKLGIRKEDRIWVINSMGMVVKVITILKPDTILGWGSI